MLQTEKQLYKGMNYLPPKEVQTIKQMVEKVEAVLMSNRITILQAIKMNRRMLVHRRGYKFFREIINMGVEEELTKYTTDTIIEYVLYSAIRSCLIRINKGKIDSMYFDTTKTFMFKLEEKYAKVGMLEFQNLIRGDLLAERVYEDYYVDIIFEQAISKGSMNLDYTIPRRVSKDLGEKGRLSSIVDELFEQAGDVGKSRTF